MTRTVNISDSDYLSVTVRTVIGYFWSWICWSLLSVTSHTTRLPAPVAVRTSGSLQWNTDRVRGLPSLFKASGDWPGATVRLVAASQNCSGEQGKKCFKNQKTNFHARQKNLFFFYKILTINFTSLRFRTKRCRRFSAWKKSINVIIIHVTAVLM